jgi:hypothetical protein
MSSCPPEVGGWSDEGDAMIIQDTDVFSRVIMPAYYRHNNWTSFVRQLNFYGFRKVKSDKNWQIFRHPLFLRGRPDLVSSITKQKTGEIFIQNTTITFVMIVFM